MGINTKRHGQGLKFLPSDSTSCDSINSDIIRHVGGDNYETPEEQIKRLDVEIYVIENTIIHKKISKEKLHFHIVVSAKEDYWLKTNMPIPCKSACLNKVQCEGEGEGNDNFYLSTMRASWFDTIDEGMKACNEFMIERPDAKVSFIFEIAAKERD